MLQLRVFWKIATIILGVSLLSSLWYSSLTTRTNHQLAESAAQQRLEDIVGCFRSASDLESGNQTEFFSRLDNVAASTGVVLALFDAGEQCVYDSAADVTESVRATSDVERIIRNAQLDYATTIASPDRKAMQFYSARHGQHVLRAGMPLDEIHRSVSAANRQSRWSALLAGILSGGIAGLLSGLILRPVGRLVRRIRDDTRPHDPASLQATRDEFKLVDWAFQQQSREAAMLIDRLRSDNNRLSAVLEGMTEGVIAVDLDQRILLANDAAGKLLGFVPVEVENERLQDVVRQTELQNALDVAMNQSALYETEVESLDKSRTLSITSSALPGRPCPGAILVLQDISELRRLESIRQEFVANVSHELKTPLSAIKACAETLSGGRD